METTGYETCLMTLSKGSVVLTVISRMYPICIPHIYPRYIPDTSQIIPRISQIYPRYIPNNPTYIPHISHMDGVETLSTRHGNKLSRLACYIPLTYWCCCCLNDEYKYTIRYTLTSKYPKHHTLHRHTLPFTPHLQQAVDSINTLHRHTLPCTPHLQQ